MNDLKYLFLYPGKSRISRLQSFIPGQSPREFFYGYLAAIEAGYSCTIGDTRTDPSATWRQAFLKYEIMRNRVTNYPVSKQRVDVLADDFRGSDVAMSFTDGFSVAMGLWARKLAPKTYLAGGFHGLADMLDKVEPWVRAIAKKRIRKGLHGLDHIFFSGAPDRRRAIEIYDLDPQRTSVFPFGVDTRFWTPGDGRTKPFVLAVGSDPQRDYETLIAAPTDVHLKFVTRLPVPPRAKGICEIIRGSLHDAAITDDALRELYRQCDLVVVPLRDVWQPSGCSVTLQAMACGKPVILTATRGLWDPTLLRSGHNCVLVPPADKTALADAIDMLMADPKMRARIGAAARKTAVEEFDVERMDSTVIAMMKNFADEKSRRGDLEI